MKFHIFLSALQIQPNPPMPSHWCLLAMAGLMFGRCGQRGGFSVLLLNARLYSKVVYQLPSYQFTCMSIHHSDPHQCLVFLVIIWYSPASALMKDMKGVKPVYHSHFSLNTILILLSRPIHLLSGNQCAYTFLSYVLKNLLPGMSMFSDFCITG